MGEWIRGARTKDNKVIIHHLTQVVKGFLPMVEMDRNVLHEKFKDHDNWLELAACILDGQDEFVIGVYEDEKLEFFDFISGNGFKVTSVGIVTNGSISLGYVLKVKKCQ